MRNTNIKLRLYINEEPNHHTPRATKERQRDKDDLGRVREIHDVIVTGREVQKGIAQPSLEGRKFSNSGDNRGLKYVVLNRQNYSVVC